MNYYFESVQEKETETIYATNQEKKKKTDKAEQDCDLSHIEETNRFGNRKAIWLAFKNRNIEFSDMKLWMRYLLRKLEREIQLKGNVSELEVSGMYK
jgi:hypothetical protein